MKILSFGNKVFESLLQTAKKRPGDRQVEAVAKDAKLGIGITATFVSSATFRRLSTPDFVTNC
jgi:hypothetical protein